MTTTMTLLLLAAGVLCFLLFYRITDLFEKI